MRFLDGLGRRECWIALAIVSFGAFRAAPSLAASVPEHPLVVLDSRDLPSFSGRPDSLRLEPMEAITEDELDPINTRSRIIRVSPDLLALSPQRVVPVIVTLLPPPHILSAPRSLGDITDEHRLSWIRAASQRLARSWSGAEFYPVYGLTHLPVVVALATPREAQRIATDSLVAHIGPVYWASPSRIEGGSLMRAANSGGSDLESLVGSTADVVVALIDTGICEALSTELTGKVVRRVNYIPEECNYTEYTAPFHGTRMAGIIAGTQFGMAKGAKLWDLKALPHSGAGAHINVIMALQDILIAMAESGSACAVDVVSMSLQLGDPAASECSANNPALSLAAQALSNLGVVLVGATGNTRANGFSVIQPGGGTGMTVEGVTPPGCLGSVVSVSAVWDRDFSGTFRGPTSPAPVVPPSSTTPAKSCKNFDTECGSSDCSAGNALDCFTSNPHQNQICCYANYKQGITATFAPGEIADALETGGSLTCFISGTSSATAYASGVAALLKAKFGFGMKSDDFRQAVGSCVPGLPGAPCVNAVIDVNGNTMSAVRLDAIAAHDYLIASLPCGGPGEDACVDTLSPSGLAAPRASLDSFLNASKCPANSNQQVCLSSLWIKAGEQNAPMTISGGGFVKSLCPGNSTSVLFPGLQGSEVRSCESLCITDVTTCSNSNLEITPDTIGLAVSANPWTVERYSQCGTPPCWFSEGSSTDGRMLRLQPEVLNPDGTSARVGKLLTVQIATPLAKTISPGTVRFRAMALYPSGQPAPPSLGEVTVTATNLSPNATILLRPNDGGVVITAKVKNVSTNCVPPSGSCPPPATEKCGDLQNGVSGSITAELIPSGTMCPKFTGTYNVIVCNDIDPTKGALPPWERCYASAQSPSSGTSVPTLTVFDPRRCIIDDNGGTATPDYASTLGGTVDVSTRDALFSRDGELRMHRFGDDAVTNSLTLGEWNVATSRRIQVALPAASAGLYSLTYYRPGSHLGSLVGTIRVADLGFLPIPQEHRVEIVDAENGDHLDWIPLSGAPTGVDVVPSRRALVERALLLVANESTSTGTIGWLADLRSPTSLIELKTGSYNSVSIRKLSASRKGDILAITYTADSLERLALFDLSSVAFPRTTPLTPTATMSGSFEAMDFEGDENGLIGRTRRAFLVGRYAGSSSQEVAFYVIGLDPTKSDYLQLAGPHLFGMRWFVGDPLPSVAVVESANPSRVVASNGMFLASACAADVAAGAVSSVVSREMRGLERLVVGGGNATTSGPAHLLGIVSSFTAGSSLVLIDSRALVVASTVLVDDPIGIHRRTSDGRVYVPELRPADGATQVGVFSVNGIRIATWPARNGAITPAVQEYSRPGRRLSMVIESVEAAPSESFDRPSHQANLIADLSRLEEHIQADKEDVDEQLGIARKHVRDWVTDKDLAIAVVSSLDSIEVSGGY